MLKGVFSISLWTCLLLTFLSSSNTFAVDSSSMIGTHEISMRTRLQSVNDASKGDATAKTTRVTLTSKFDLDDDKQWQFLVEPNYVYAFNDGEYNSVTVTKNTSGIADPQNFNWNKINFLYKSDDDWRVTLGRQLLSFDNERMIGTSEFWQTPQSFDAIKFDYNDHINWRFQYAYSNKVNRIYGHSSTQNIPEDDVRYTAFMTGDLEQRPLNEWGEHKLNAHLFNLGYKTENNLSIVVYDYLVENKDKPDFSTNTLGVRLSDEFKPEKVKYAYNLEFALQNNAYQNPKNYNTWYNLIEGSVQYKSHILQLSQEVFSQDKNSGFSMPLASRHKFQGWTDAFDWYSSNRGLRDVYMTYRGRNNKLRWRVVLHKLKSYKTDERIGDEIDIELAYRITRKWELKFVYADFSSQKGVDESIKTRDDINTWFMSIAYNI